MLKNLSGKKKREKKFVQIFQQDDWNNLFGKNGT
jgi:hypothetical protein